jgi:undecaprenyl-diphosphatase
MSDLHASHQTSSTSTSSRPALRHSTLTLTVVLVSFLLFLLITYLALAGDVFQQLDQRLLTYFANLERQLPAWFITLSTGFQNVTSLGMGIISALLILYWLLKRNTRRFYLMLASVGGAQLLWMALVFGIGRPRPEKVIIWGGVNLPSYPSGHVMVNVGFYAGLVYIFYAALKSQTQKRLVLGVAAVMLLLIGANRLLFSAHYLTDLLGGYAIGTAWAAFALWVVEWFLARRE